MKYMVTPLKIPMYFAHVNSLLIANRCIFKKSLIKGIKKGFSKKKVKDFPQISLYKAFQ